MPQLMPQPGPTWWPPEELAIGVVGVAPWATLDFCRALYGLVDAKKDWHYPRLIVDANSKIPSRGRHLDLGEADPSPAIRETIVELAATGAGVVVVPCNTAHLLYPRWAKDVPIPVPHIMRASVERVVATGGTAVAVLQSVSLRASGAYARTLKEYGLRIIGLTDDECLLVAELIASVKLRGEADPDERAAFARLVEALASRGADTLIFGCTELSGLVPGASSAIRCVDSNVELARKALTLARGPLKYGPVGGGTTDVSY